MSGLSDTSDIRVSLIQKKQDGFNILFCLLSTIIILLLLLLLLLYYKCTYISKLEMQYLPLITSKIDSMRRLESFHSVFS
jgi:nucleoside permease NupC